MDDNLRKGIHFDLDTKALQTRYQNGDWHNAYKDIRAYLEEHSFEHIQGSGYHSLLPMSQASTVAQVEAMSQALPWINGCVKVCTIADVPESYDLSYLFDSAVSR